MITNFRNDNGDGGTLPPFTGKRFSTKTIQTLVRINTGEIVSPGYLASILAFLSGGLQNHTSFSTSFRP